VYFDTNLAFTMPFADIIDYRLVKVVIIAVPVSLPVHSTETANVAFCQHYLTIRQLGRGVLKMFEHPQCRHRLSCMNVDTTIVTFARWCKSFACL
jgi:hypothetical protein